MSERTASLPRASFIASEHCLAGSLSALSSRFIVGGGFLSLLSSPTPSPGFPTSLSSTTNRHPSGIRFGLGGLTSAWSRSCSSAKWEKKLGSTNQISALRSKKGILLEHTTAIPFSPQKYPSL